MLYGSRFNVLFVCQANICRSPLAEHLARRAISQSFGPLGATLSVSSAGTHADHGSAMHPGTAQVLTERGIAEPSWTSRPLTSAMVADAGLVLAVARTQRARCVELAPRAMRRTFTLRQFARIAGRLPPSVPDAETTPEVKFRTAVERVTGWRNRVQPGSANDDDIADPVREPIDAFRDCAAAMEEDLRIILTAVERL
jgi:protein-tyrosine phosphatase